MSRRAGRSRLEVWYLHASPELPAAPDTATWHGRRDHAVQLVATQTGLSVSELTALTIDNTHLGTGAHAYCRGRSSMRHKQQHANLSDNFRRTALAHAQWQQGAHRGLDGVQVHCLGGHAPLDVGPDHGAHQQDGDRLRVQAGRERRDGHLGLNGLPQCCVVLADR